MRRLLLTLDFPPERGGIQRYLDGIVRHDYVDGDLVVAPGKSSGGSELCGSVRIERVPRPFLNVKSALPFIVARLLAGLGDGAVVECGNVHAALAAWIVSFVKPIRYSVYTYGTELLPAAGWGPGAMLLRAVLRKAEHCTVLGAYTKSLLLATGYKGPIRVVPPRIDAPNSFRSMPCRQGTFRVLCVGRLVPHKGQRVLIDAMALVSRVIPWRLVIAGTGEQEEHLRTRCSSAGIHERVVFAGALTDNELNAEYSKASVVVLPSISTRTGVEGFGIVLLEAMAYGCPLVASAVGGIPEVLEQGNCGLLVEPENPLALAAAVETIHNNRMLAERLVSAASRRLREQYVWR